MTFQENISLHVFCQGSLQIFSSLTRFVSPRCLVNSVKQQACGNELRIEKEKQCYILQNIISLSTTEKLAFISTLSVSYYPEEMNSKLTHATKLVTRVLSSRIVRIYRNLS